MSKDVVTIVEADVKFHDIIYRATDNDRLIQIINNLREQMYRYRLEYIKDARTHASLIAEHNEIIKQIAAQNVEAAQKDMYKHIYNQERGILKVLEKEA
jgi:DNA-binding GntR family transcriptional regulator